MLARLDAFLRLLVLVCAAIGVSYPFQASNSAPSRAAPSRIAVFEFELENTSPSGATWGETSKDSPTMTAITDQVRGDLAQSGKFEIVDTSHVDAQEVSAHTLRSCHGCDADFALKLGADRSLIGVISKAGNTEYYASIRLTDAKLHKVIFQKMSFFIGGEDSWSTGARELTQEAISHAGD